MVLILFLTKIKRISLLQQEFTRELICQQEFMSRRVQKILRKLSDCPQEVTRVMPEWLGMATIYGFHIIPRMREKRRFIWPKYRYLISKKSYINLIEK